MKAPTFPVFFLFALLGGLVPVLAAQSDDGTLPPGKERPHEEDLPPQGDLQKMESLQGPENMNIQVFTDPDPLPRGGRGTLYVLLNIGKGRFLTRGRGETFLKPPRKAGPLTLGKVQWPPSSGNFRHPETGRIVPGWTGQVFVKIPIQVEGKAPLGPVSFKIDFQYRVLSVKPPIAGMVNVDPIEFQAKIGPPLPVVTFPERSARSGPAAGGKAAGKAPGKKPSSPERKAPPLSPGTPGKGGALPGRPPSPSSRGQGDFGPGEPPILPESGGFLGKAPLVFGAAGLLVLLALFLLLRGSKTR